jgi:hypothetical protein
MNEFHDDSEVKMAGIDVPCGTARKEGKGGPDAFAAAFTGVGDVAFHCWIEFTGLLPYAFLNTVKLSIDEFKSLFDLPGGPQGFWH